ncbi:MAG TPA: hypothetical protein VFV67_04965 [Actinophytocola sp.]|uniref:hypothetical protein n=1 Tax=Actinophytocola sp. TaxID=1872138 RepID=UPI002DBF9D2C|nr:hypothetical protein [Actinophytocola sp.]HEU5469982.1 hypothetical protein [Actinophytocola sp.]
MRRIFRQRLLGAATAFVAALGLTVVTATPSWAVAPANDNFANAQAETGSFTDSVNTDEATYEGGEQIPSCTDPVDGYGRTVWYGLTISAGTEVTASTAGSNFDTVLAVWTGVSLGSLSQVSCDDDSGPGATSSLGFTASSSTTYWILVGGSNLTGPFSGDLALDVDATTPGADVSVSVGDSADPVSVGGSPYTYTVSVANGGPNGATGVSVSTSLSGASGAAWTVNSATPSQGSCSGTAPVSCSLGSIAASGGASVVISVTPSATGTITASSTVSANESDPVSGNNSDAESTTVNNALGCTIIGTSGANTLTGTSGNDVICGLGGADTIDGGSGNDTIYAGDGDDAVGGGNGNDTIYGQGGNDDNDGETLLGALLHLFDNGSDYIDGGPGTDLLDGQNGDDTLVDHDGADTLSGGTGNDSIDVQDGVGNDTADGGLGSDTCLVDTGDGAISC